MSQFAGKLFSHYETEQTEEEADQNYIWHIVLGSFILVLLFIAITAVSIFAMKKYKRSKYHPVSSKVIVMN